MKDTKKKDEETNASAFALRATPRQEESKGLQGAKNGEDISKCADASGKSVRLPMDSLTESDFAPDNCGAR